MINNIKEQINNLSKYDKIRSKKYSEVFTPNDMIIKMLEEIEDFDWYDPNKKILDPCAGKGNFVIYIIEKLMITLKNIIEDEEERYKHIIENMIYMYEIQEESCNQIKNIFSMNGKYKVNIYNKDYLN